MRNHARIDIINIMTFDYYDDAPHEMGKDTVTAATAVVDQLKTIYPHKSTAQLWQMLGITEMVGIDDYGPPEVFTTADAAYVENWARRTGIAELSFWALERDDGGCVGTAGQRQLLRHRPVHLAVQPRIRALRPAIAAKPFGASRGGRWPIRLLPR